MNKEMFVICKKFKGLGQYWTSCHEESGCWIEHPLLAFRFLSRESAERVCVHLNRVSQMYDLHGYNHSPASVRKRKVTLKKTKVATTV